MEPEPIDQPIDRVPTIADLLRCWLGEDDATRRPCEMVASEIQTMLCGSCVRVLLMQMSGADLVQQISRLRDELAETTAYAGRLHDQLNKP